MVSFLTDTENGPEKKLGQSLGTNSQGESSDTLISEAWLGAVKAAKRCEGRMTLETALIMSEFK